MWPKLVGADLASHCRPVKLEDGELTIEAESTAWATQLRLLAGRLLTRIAAEVGRDVVTRIHVHGPAAPSWARARNASVAAAPRHVRLTALVKSWARSVCGLLLRSGHCR